MLGHFLDTFTDPSRDGRDLPRGTPFAWNSVSDTKSGALSSLRLSRSVSTERPWPPVTVYPAALKSSANSDGRTEGRCKKRETGIPSRKKEELLLLHYAPLNTDELQKFFYYSCAH